MPLSPGARFGPYEIAALIGAGGMGDVYRATDTTLERDVAIKVLPDAFAQDVDLIARFEREARTLASLNHANIAIIHGLERAGDTRALVMELVDGPTLADRIARGPLPLDEALPIARQVAAAVEAAHEQGIIHRDLKPANIKITPGGTAKVLDFGLARSGFTAGDSSGRSNLATTPATMPGVILGTPQYMSPEQAGGKPIDGSSDVWAFGCVLYEMLTGRRPFVGGTTGEILAAVLTSEPDWRPLPSSTPGSIRRLLRRSLQKDPRLRLRDMRDARLEIDDGGAAEPDPGDAVQVRARPRERLVWASGLAVVTLAAVALGVRAARPTPIAAEVRLEINTPATRNPSLAVSPDGRRIVFAALSAAGAPQLWLRSLDSTSARPVPGTEGASLPFWSPDGRSVGFFADSRLKRADLDGGSVRIVVPVVDAPMGASWNSQRVILYSMRPGLPILRVAEDGGEARPVTRFDPPHRGQSSPMFLPDGRHFLFFVTGSAEARGIYVGQIDSPDITRLIDADAPAVYAATGHLLFIRGSTLFAQRFDADRLELAGEPFPMADGVNAGTRLSASAAGPIAYATAAADTGQRQLAWFDRSGREIERVVYEDVASLGPSLSADGRHVAVFRLASGNMDLWSYDRRRRLWDRITVDRHDEIFPLWSGDGTRLVFAASRGLGLDLYSKRLGTEVGQGEELLLSTAEPKWPMDLTRDGRLLLCTSLNSATGADLWALPLTGDRTPFAVMRTEFTEQLPQFSPDGQWIAYQSNHTGRFEIYLRRLRASGRGTPVSAGGGAQVRWNANGTELFYVSADDWLMAAPIRVAPGGELEPGPAVRLFKTNVGSAAPNLNRHQYAVSPDGQSFVMNAVVGEPSGSPITVILNWSPERRF